MTSDSCAYAKDTHAASSKERPRCKERSMMMQCGGRERLKGNAKYRAQIISKGPRPLPVKQIVRRRSGWTESCRRSCARRLLQRRLQLKGEATFTLVCLRAPTQRLGGARLAAGGPRIERRHHIESSKNIHLTCINHACVWTNSQAVLCTMSSWIQDSPRLSLGLTAVVSGALAASAVIGLQNAKKWYSIHDLKGSIPDASSKHDVEKVCTF